MDSPSKGPSKVTVRKESLDTFTLSSVIGEILWKHLELSRKFGISHLLIIFVTFVSFHI